MFRISNNSIIAFLLPDRTGLIEVLVYSLRGEGFTASKNILQLDV